MCGIVGSIGRVPDAGVREDALGALSHRGPDGKNETVSGSTWFGHTRLSIIDLSMAGNQPMARPGLGLLAFNGEIYDYESHRRRLAEDGCELTSRSDTEVLLQVLAREGPEGLGALHGMWAFAFQREESGEVLLGRDHAGMKPLYVWRGEGCVAFASEIRALCIVIRGLGEEPKTSIDAIADVLRFGSVAEPRAFIRDVEVVPPAEVWRLSKEGRTLGRVRVRWKGDSSAGTREAVTTAVGRHLVSDVPVAVFLSGGVDSGVIAVTAARSGRTSIEAITVELGSRMAADEPDIAERLAARVGFRITRVPLQNWADQIPTALKSYDQPSIDGLNTFVISSVAREMGFKVALSGVGADEVYGGYRHLRRRWPHRRTAREGSTTRLSRTLAAAASLAAPNVGRRVACLAEGWTRGELTTRSSRRLLPESQIERLVPGCHTDLAHAEEDLLVVERATYLKDTLLRDTDVMGMANGLEIRAPYLDPIVMRDAYRIGTEQLLSPSRLPKWPLREAFGEELEAATLRRKKTGFMLGIRGWMLGDGRNHLEEAFARFPRWRCFDAEAATRLTGVARRALMSPHPAAAVLSLLVMQLNAALERFGEP